MNGLYCLSTRICAFVVDIILIVVSKLQSFEEFSPQHPQAFFISSQFQVEQSTPSLQDASWLLVLLGVSSGLDCISSYSGCDTSLHDVRSALKCHILSEMFPQSHGASSTMLNPAPAVRQNLTFSASYDPDRPLDIGQPDPLLRHKRDLTLAYNSQADYHRQMPIPWFLTS